MFRCFIGSITVWTSGGVPSSNMVPIGRQQRRVTHWFLVQSRGQQRCGYSVSAKHMSPPESMNIEQQPVANHHNYLWQEVLWSVMFVGWMLVRLFFSLHLAIGCNGRQEYGRLMSLCAPGRSGDLWALFLVVTAINMKLEYRSIINKSYIPLLAPHS